MDEFQSLITFLLLHSKKKKRLSAKGKNQEWIVGVRRMIQIFKGGTEKGV